MMIADEDTHDQMYYAEMSSRPRPQSARIAAPSVSTICHVVNTSSIVVFLPPMAKRMQKMSRSTLLSMV